jgi:hypothetical protein
MPIWFVGGWFVVSIDSATGEALKESRSARRAIFARTFVHCIFISVGMSFCAFHFAAHVFLTCLPHHPALLAEH